MLKKTGAILVAVSSTMLTDYSIAAVQEVRDITEAPGEKCEAGCYADHCPPDFMGDTTRCDSLFEECIEGCHEGIRNSKSADIPAATNPCCWRTCTAAWCDKGRCRIGFTQCLNSCNPDNCRD